MCKIVWLEDEKFFVQKLMRPITDMGHKVRIFENVSSAFKDFSAFEDADLAVVDLIVDKEDLGLEDAFEEDASFDPYYGGLALLRKLSSLPNPPKTLVLSVVVSEDILEQARQYTPHLLTKPVRLSEFTDKVLELLPTSPN